MVERPMHLSIMKSVYPGALQVQISFETSNWCNNLTRAGEITDIQLWIRIYCRPIS